MTRRAICAVAGGVLMVFASVLIAMAAGAESALGIAGALVLGIIGVWLMAESFAD